MTNETFTLLSDAEKNTKFRTALRQKTGNRLTEDELNIIISSLPPNKQYEIHVFSEPTVFCSYLVLANAGKSKLLFGSAIPGVPGISEIAFCKARSSAFLENKGTGIINIYIPQARELI